jgi:hypothetical protein
MPFNFLTRHDSATSFPAPSTRTTQPHIDIKSLLNRNEELSMQSTLNQELFSAAHKELLNKQTENHEAKLLIAALKNTIRQSDASHACEISSLETENQALVKKLSNLGAATALREETLRAENKELVEQVGQLRDKNAGREKAMGEFRSQSTALSAYCSELEVGHNTLHTEMEALKVSHEAQLASLQASHNTEVENATAGLTQKPGQKDKTVKMLAKRAKLLKDEVDGAESASHQTQISELQAELVELQIAHEVEIAGWEQKLEGKEKTVKMLGKRTKILKGKVEKAEAAAAKTEPARFGVARPEPELEFVSER